MGTRAILAKQFKNGKYITGWQWNDGDITIANLKKWFPKEEYLDTLISLGEWKGLYTDKNKEKFIAWCAENNIEEPVFTKIGNINILLDKFKMENKTEENEFCSPKVYDSIKDMLDEDLNFVYVFNPENGEWKKYRYDGGIIMENEPCYFRQEFSNMNTSVLVENPIQKGSKAYLFDRNKNEWQEGVVTDVVNFTDMDLQFGDFCAELCTPAGDCTIGIEQLVPCTPPAISKDCIIESI